MSRADHWHHRQRRQEHHDVAAGEYPARPRSSHPGGGNIGRSLLPSLSDITPDTLVVLELSSFQLEHLAWQHYSPPLAIVLNLAPNHLDRHGTMEAYQRAKEHILAYQTPADTAILNWDDAIVRHMARRGQGQRLYFSMQDTLPEGFYRQGTTLVMARAGHTTPLCQQSDLSVRGAHNFSNAGGGRRRRHSRGTASDHCPGSEHFSRPAAPARASGNKSGVEYYNDSKATTPLSTMRAPGLRDAGDSPGGRL